MVPISPGVDYETRFAVSFATLEMSNGSSVLMQFFPQQRAVFESQIFFPPSEIG